jgi:DNA polymerase III delta prime subunit
MMASLDDVYRQFGETAEAAQLLETELGNMALMIKVLEKNLILEKNTDLATSIFDKINKSTLGQLLKQVGKSPDHIDEIYSKLENALKVRNRLAHSFYREHNFRRNTEDGRSIMLEDLINMHDILLEAYRELLEISNSKLFDVDIPIPKKHVNI